MSPGWPGSGEERYQRPAGGRRGLVPAGPGTPRRTTAPPPPPHHDRRGTLTSDVPDGVVHCEQWRDGARRDDLRFPIPRGGHPAAVFRKGSVVDTWVIVLIVAVALVALALVALALAKRSRVAGAKRREQQRLQAREHLEQAQLRGAQAEKEQALAEEQAARARRERAEVEERTRLAEQQARQRAATAREHATAAEKLRAEAERLAPGLADQNGHARVTGDGPGGATRR